MASERELIERARSSPDAFRELYRLYFARIYAYVAYRAGRKQDAEDIVAETFMHVVESLDQFEYRGEGSFAAWLFRIAYNQIQQFYRQRHINIESFSLDDLGDHQSDGPTPDQVFADKERFARLRDALATLAPRRQEIVTLKFFGGLRNQEIAEVLDLNERTVASHLSRALDDLQRSYGIQPEKESLP